MHSAGLVGSKTTRRQHIYVDLTFNGIGLIFSDPMIPRSVASVLVFSWIALSGFDLLEDLRFGSKPNAYSQSDKPYSPQWNPHRSLVNNIVESAINGDGGCDPLLRLSDSYFDIRPLSSVLRVVELHKLHRVFLI
jgi:hypothetical protein